MWVLCLVSGIKLTCCAQQAYEEYDDKWELIRMTHAPMTAEEYEERDEALTEVVDPMFLRDAEGELEIEDGGTEFMQGLDSTENVSAVA